MILEKLHKSFSHLSFYEQGHIYVDNRTGKSPKSATTTIAELQPEFDTRYWTTYKSLQRAGYDVRKVDQDNILLDGILTHIDRAYSIASTLQVTPRQVELEWNGVSREGKEEGTFTHKYVEGSIFGKKCNNPTPLQQLADQWVNSDYVEGNFIPMRMEVIVGNEFICGQFDNLSSFKRDLFLRDYKTDKKFEHSNKWQTFLYPLNHLDDCEFNKYSLQLSIYRYLLEDVADIKIHYNQVIWFDKINLECNVIDLPYLKDEAEYLCNEHNKRTYQCNKTSDQQVR